jgi:hypothetical protein
LIYYFSTIVFILVFIEKESIVFRVSAAMDIRYYWHGKKSL